MKLESLGGPGRGRKTPKRLGRGQGSGKGGTSGRGTKGYRSRSGSKRRAWYEGGQMPLQRRIPKRGFSNAPFENVYQLVHLRDIRPLDVQELDAHTMKEKGLIKSTSRPVKVLADGDIDTPMVIRADAFSRSAVAKIEKAGGKAVLP
ncbi:MAG: 50S ribosomal protein L15 [Fidelibacterota bacterium]